MILLVTEHKNLGFEEALSKLGQVFPVISSAIPRPHSLEWAVGEALLQQTFSLAIVAVTGGLGIPLCNGVKGCDNAPPIIWISTDEGYEHWAEKIGVEDFWVAPMPPMLLQKQAAYFLGENTKL